VVPPFQIPPSTNAATPSLVRVDATSFAVAYVDNRSGDWEVYLTRFDQSGPLSNVRVTNAPGLDWHTSLVTAGSKLAAVWYELPNGDTTEDIFYATIDATGAVQESRVTNLNQRAYSPSVVWTGTNSIVAWRDIRNGTWDLYESTIDGAGVVGAAVPLTNGADVRGTSLARSGGQIALAFVDLSDPASVVFSRLDTTPALVPVNSAVGAEESVKIVPLEPGPGYAVAWFDTRTGAPHLYVRFVDGMGMPLGAEIPVAGMPTFSGPNFNPPAATWNGHSLAVTWSDGADVPRQIHLAEVCPN